MRAYEALIAWTPKSWESDRWIPGCKVGPLTHADDPDWTWPYAFTGGAAYLDRRKLQGHESVKLLFVDFHTIVVRDGVDLQAAHEAFLAIEEYRQTISRDIAGASD